MGQDNEKTTELRVREMPAGLHKQFRHLCLDEEISIGNKVIELIREYVSKNKSKVLK